MLARLPPPFASLALGGKQSSPGSSVAEARQALTFWRGRLSRLSWHRRAARREARLMVSRSRARLVRAHLEDHGLRSGAFALEPLMVAEGGTRLDHVRWLSLTVLRRTPFARRWLFAAAIVAICSLTALALLAVIAGQLLAF